MARKRHEDDGVSEPNLWTITKDSPVTGAPKGNYAERSSDPAISPPAPISERTTIKSAASILPIQKTLPLRPTAEPRDFPRKEIAPGRSTPSAPLRRWSAEQNEGIQTVGKSLLVSAAAGSGKTTVLAERCAYLVCNAPDACDVDELLVVTFTEAAALEMKTRIAAALQSRAAGDPGERIGRQMALVDQANVSTIHSFCARMLRQNFNLVGLDPAFRVLDGDEAHLLRLEVSRSLLRDAYDQDETGDFHALIDAYCDGQDDRILHKILHAHDMLTSVVDPEAWLENARRRIAEAAEGALEESELGKELVILLGQGLEAIKLRCDRAKFQVAQLGFAKYVPYVVTLRGILESWSRALESDGIDALSEVAKDAENLPRLPSDRGDLEIRDRAQVVINVVRKQMKEGAWRNLLRFSASQWQEGLAAIVPHASAFINLVSQFAARYRSAKAALGAVDFSDLEQYALAVLRDPAREGLAPSAAALAYHRRFAHVLVDEYQDINEVQDAILHLVSRECVAGRRGVVSNFFCVGDVKQSIYRFRLAEPKRFLDRERQLRADPGRGEVIDLSKNYRSRAPLLEAINSVFERLMTADAVEITYDQTHRLRSGKEFPPAGEDHCFAGAPIELHLLPAIRGAAKEETESEGDETDDADDLDRTEREAVLVAKRIRQIIGLDGTPPMSVMHDGRNGPEPRPAKFSDIVILLRAMRFKASQFADILRQHDIPVHADGGSGFFASVEVRDMLSLLALLDNLRQDIPLAAVLRSPLARLPNPEDALARVRIAYPAGEEGLPFHEAVLKYAAEREDELAGFLRDFFAQVSDWRVAAGRRPLADVIWQIYLQTGYLAFVSGLIDGEQRAANLMHLHQRAGQFGDFQRQGVSRFIRFLEDLEGASDIAQASVASEAQDVVKIKSIHGAKGLEFPIVILPDLGKTINQRDTHGHILIDRAAGLGMSVVDHHMQSRYPSLALMLVAERLRRQTLAEELRVLYVAMTRAKEHLFLVGTCGEESPQKWAAQWAGHRGALPAPDVLDARSMLDWLGPVAAAAGDSFCTTAYPMNEVSAWRSPAATRLPFTLRQQALARLEPLEDAGSSVEMTPATAAGSALRTISPSPQMASATQGVDAADANFPSDDNSTDASSTSVAQDFQRAIDRISFVYPFRAFSGLAASQSVTSRKTKDVASTRPRPAINADNLPRPTFLSQDVTSSPAERGTATHLVLEHFNFAGTCNLADVSSQVESLVVRRVLTVAQAALVDCDAILWFLDSSVGRIVRENAGSIRREVPVCYPADASQDSEIPPAADPMDRVMVRGRIDLLVPTPAGAVIVDYKTDNVREEDVAYRAEEYHPQMQAYREAIERITGQPTAGVYLVFLTPRVVWEE